MDGCRIVAVSTPYSSGRIELIFVNAPKKAAAVKFASKLAAQLSTKCQVTPFEGSEPWVAIICPLTGLSRQFSPSLFLYPGKGKDVRFIGWQGKLLRVQMEYKSTNYLRKKHRGIAEMLVDLTTTNIDHVEFRLSKGHLENEDMKDFICSRIMNSSHYLPEFIGRQKSELRTKFPGYELISYSVSSDFCIANKGKVFHAGSIEAVADYISSKHSIARFSFPEEESAWPTSSLAENEKNSSNAKKDTSTAMGSTQKPSADTQPTNPSNTSSTGIVAAATRKNDSADLPFMAYTTPETPQSPQSSTTTPASSSQTVRYGMQRTAMGSYYGPIVENASNSAINTQEPIDVAKAIKQYVEMLNTL